MLSKIVLYTFTVAATVSALSSLAWRMDVDSPLMLYAAWLMNEHHYVPYRDLFEMNMPGTYLMYGLIGRVLGYGDLGFRAADLMLLGTLLWATFRITRAFGRQVAWAACVAFALAYLTAGSGVTMQREYLVLVFVSLGMVLVLPGQRAPALALSVLAGMAMGAAATIKPHSAFAFAWLLFFRVRLSSATGRENPRARILDGAAMIAGFLAPLLLACAYLAAIGAWTPFWDIARNYWPLYGELDHNHRAVSGAARIGVLIDGLRHSGPWLWLVPATAGVVSSLQRGQTDDVQRPTVFLILGLAVFFAIYPAFSGQFWPYHWLPETYFLVLLSSLCLRGDALASTPSKARLALFWGTLVFMSDMASQFFEDTTGASRTPQGGRVDEMARLLTERMRPGDRVQPLDWATGAVHAMLVAKAPLATRFMYDFHFRHHVSTPYIMGLRREFLSELEASPPRFVLAIDYGEAPSGEDTSRDFPGLQHFLDQRYAPAATGDHYVVFERR